MPITEQLKTSEQLQQAGLPHAAAILLAEKIEAAAQATHDTALDRFRAELRGELSQVRTEIAQARTEVSQIRAEIAAAETRLNVKIADGLREVEKSIRTSQTFVLSAIGLVILVLGALKVFG